MPPISCIDVVSNLAGCKYRHIPFQPSPVAGVCRSSICTWFLRNHGGNVKGGRPLFDPEDWLDLPRPLRGAKRGCLFVSVRLSDASELGGGCEACSPSFSFPSFFPSSGSSGGFSGELFGLLDTDRICMREESRILLPDRGATTKAFVNACTCAKHRAAGRRAPTCIRTLNGRRQPQ